MRSNLGLLKVLRLALCSLTISASVSNANGVFAYDMTGAPSTDISPAVTYSSRSEELALTSPGTAKLQAQVLMRVNQALSQGSISAADASNLKDQINRLGDTESWYKTLEKPIPASLVQEDTRVLTQLSTDLEKNHPLKPELNSADALHTNIDELISSALAQNKITSSQAEGYYSRLAQIESNLETLKTDSSPAPDAVAEVNQSLGKLENDVQSHIQK
jgi:hypothetical protein